MSIFYTYLIKCIPTGEYYYGVRYSVNSNPDELQKTYFTSSKVVKSNRVSGSTTINKGKTYEEILGIEKSTEIKKLRSEQLKKNNPGKKMLGKTYRELYGQDGAENSKRLDLKLVYLIEKLIKYITRINQSSNVIEKIYQKYVYL